MGLKKVELVAMVEELQSKMADFLVEGTSVDVKALETRIDKAKKTWVADQREIAKLREGGINIKDITKIRLFTNARGKKIGEVSFAVGGGVTMFEWSIFEQKDGSWKCVAPMLRSYQDKTGKTRYVNAVKTPGAFGEELGIVTKAFAEENPSLVVKYTFKK